MVDGHKVGIMGGTFNPVHNGHLLLAQEALEALSLDRVLFIPSGNSYMKRSEEILEASARAHMVRLAIEGNERFCLSECEINRQGPTYTCDTLTQLRSQNPTDQYFFILGADSLFSLKDWKNPEMILESAEIIAAVRGSVPEERIKEEAKLLAGKYGARIHILMAHRMDISSTEIRQRIQNGQTVRYMLPENVLQYIEENRFYRK